MRLGNVCVVFFFLDLGIIIRRLGCFGIGRKSTLLMPVCLSVLSPSAVYFLDV